MSILKRINNILHSIRVQKENKDNFFLLFWRFSLLLIPLIILIPGMNGFPYPSSEANFSDISITHYPYAHYLRQIIIEQHRIPLWNSLILSGHPFAANPLSGLWYPPGWLALIIPLPFAFNLLVALHLIWGGLGMYALLRSEGLAHQSALFSAVIFEGLPKFFAHFGAGHLTLLFAIPWTPWLLWASRVSHLSTKSKFSWKEAAILGLIFVADVRWIVFAGLVWFFYTLSLLDFSKKQLMLERIILKSIHVLMQSLIAVFLTAPFLFLFLEFTQYSSRVQMSFMDITSYSLPVSQLLGLIFPSFGGFHEWMLYTGAFGFIFIVLIMVYGLYPPRSRFWLWCLLISLLFSLEPMQPFFEFIESVPVLNLLRVPTRTLFLSGICIAILSGYNLQILIGSLSNDIKRRVRLALFGILAFVISISFASWLYEKELSINFLWGTIFFFIAILWIFIRLNTRLKTEFWTLGLFLIVMLDLGVVDHSLFYLRSVKQIFSEGQAVADWLVSEPGLFRVYSPSYSIPQHTAANYHLQLSDGVDPMQLASYVKYMEAASGVPVTGYTVTLPPFENGVPSTANKNNKPDLIKLGMLNIGYLTSAYELDLDGLVLINQYGDSYLYRNEYVYPRAWMAKTNSHDLDEIIPLDIQYWSSDQIVIEAQGSGVLVLSELAYPGWQVFVDGKKNQMDTVFGILRSVRLRGSGNHIVVFSYQPIWLYIGLTLSVFTITMLSIYSLMQKRGNLVQ